MPPTSRKRRAPFGDEQSEASSSTQTQSRSSQRQEPLDEEDEDEELDDGEPVDSGSATVAQLAKNLVRYALACEYSRIPIKRQDVSQKVMPTHTRMFRPVFAAANLLLMDVFGMQMVELPNKERVTARQKRAAAGTETQNKSSGMWVLQNILPEEYRMAGAIGPGPEPPEDVPDVEAAYVGLYTMIISLIMLSGGQIAESKLDRYLRRMNADQNTPVDTREKLFARMVKDGYIVRVKDSSSGDEVVDYIVGTRGKVEVDKQSVAAFVRTVFGDGVEDLEQRIARSLGLGEGDEGEAAADVGAGPAAGGGGGGGAGRRPGRPRRQASEDG